MASTRSIFTTWSESNADDWGKKPLCLNHRLHTDPLFSEDALADLIDRSPRDCYNINYMGEQGDRHLWREGEKGDLSGQQVIDAIRNGRFWINLRRPHDIDDRYQALLKAVFAEIEERVPHLGHTFNHKLGILISSPGAQVYYHADIPGQSLWQIAGSKRVYVYPRSNAFLPQESMEGIILGETEEEIGYEPWFDEHAVAFDVQPGEMLTWPLNAPHRVTNHDCLNISLTTEHWTTPIRNSYAVHYANGVLRRQFGLSALHHSVRSPMLYPKLAFAAAAKYLARRNVQKTRTPVDFRVDPTAPNGFVDIAPYAPPA